MSNKPYKNLDNSDAVLRMATPVGMEDGVKQVIIRHCGFEFYNTRPYHNYETWSDGYIIMGRKDGKSASYDWFIEQYNLPNKERAELFVSVSAEDLDEAAIKFAKVIGQEEKVLNHINSLLNKGTSRAMALRKKFKND
jgi:hypothetical protein